MHGKNRMERKMFIAFAMLVMLFATCGKEDSLLQPEIEKPDVVEVGNVSASAFTASVSGTFNGEMFRHRLLLHQYQVLSTVYPKVTWHLASAVSFIA